MRIVEDLVLPTRVLPVKHAYVAGLFRGRRKAKSGAACAEKGAPGRMQRPAELVPIPDASRMRPGASRMRPGCVPDASRMRRDLNSSKSVSNVSVFDYFLIFSLFLLHFLHF